MSIYDTLNDKQKEAVFHTEGPLLILAGAGSGKTRVLTHRIAYLIEEKGVNPWNILAITFTNKAAAEMRERVDNLVGFGSESIWVSTFHSMCVRILRRHIALLGYDTNFTIYDTDDQKTLMRDVCKLLQIDTKIYKERMLIGTISHAKNEMLTPEEFRLQAGGDFHQKKIADVYEEYEKQLRANNALDFDDLLLKTVYPEIDLVTTPDGSLVGMVHANNCTSDLNAWVGLFREFAESFGMEVDMNQLFGTLYNKALEGDKDCGGLLSYGYLSGENITGVTEGRPLFVRSPESRFNLANFMRTHLYTSLGALKVGMDILLKEEHVQIDKILGHGGLFKTKGVGQGILAAAIDTPVSVMETAGEGGPWGMALLASYMLNKESDETLAHYLSEKVFAGNKGTSMDPDPEDVKGFETFIERYKKGIAIEKAALENLIV